MNDLPTIGKSLQQSVSLSGYRKALSTSHQKALDRLATGEQSSRTCENLESIEKKLINILFNDLGLEWTELLWSMWCEAKADLRNLVQNITQPELEILEDYPTTLTLVTAPLIAKTIKKAHNRFRTFNIQEWISSPFLTWIATTSKEIGCDPKELESSLAAAYDVDSRTLLRWKEGRGMSRIGHPYSLGLQVKPSLAPSGKSIKRTSIHLSEMAKGWLMLSVCMQNLQETPRWMIAQLLNIEAAESWNYERSIYAIRNIEPSNLLNHSINGMIDYYLTHITESNINEDKVKSLYSFLGML